MIVLGPPVCISKNKRQNFREIISSPSEKSFQQINTPKLLSNLFPVHWKKHEKKYFFRKSRGKLNFFSVFTKLQKKRKFDHEFFVCVLMLFKKIERALMATKRRQTPLHSCPAASDWAFSSLRSGFDFSRDRRDSHGRSRLLGKNWIGVTMAERRRPQQKEWQWRTQQEESSTCCASGTESAVASRSCGVEVSDTLCLAPLCSSLDVVCYSKTMWFEEICQILELLPF